MTPASAPRGPARTGPGGRLPAPQATAARPGWGGRLRACWAAATGSGSAASAALALLVLAGVFIAVAVPRASLGYRTQVLQRIFAAASSSATTVLADADITGLKQGYLSTLQLAAAHSQLAAGLRRTGLPLASPGADWDGLVTGSSPFSVAGQPPVRTMAPPRLELIYRSGLATHGRLTAGSWPGSAAAQAPPGALQIAVAAPTAAKFQLRVGSQIRAAGHQLVVTGIIAPRRPASSFWTVDPVLPAPRLTSPGPDSPPYFSAAALIGPAQLPALQQYLPAQPLRALWSFPLCLAGVTADQAAGLLRAAQAVSYLPAASSVSTSLSNTAGSSATIDSSPSTGLSSVLPSFVATDDAVQRVLSLLFVSLAILAAVVVLLGARLVAEHRRDELALMRARGAALHQVAGIALGGGAAAVLPAAVVAALAAVAVTPGPASWLSWWLAGLIVAAALASPPLLVLWWHRARRGAAQAGPARAAAARRWVTDVALACAAAGGLVLLRQQGLPSAGRLDLFTSAAPVLVAVPAALFILRVYPPVLRRLARLAGRRRGVVLVVGFARGNAAVPAGVLPLFALVLAFAVIAFAGMARGGVARADVSASWQAAGADAVVTGPQPGPGITPAAQRLITGTPGVQRWVAVSVAQGTSSQGLLLPVVIVDPRQYAALIAATPLPAFPAAALARPGAGGGTGTGRASAVPVLVSPAARAALGACGGLWVAGRQLRFRAVGTLPAVAGGPAGTQFAVLPRWALGPAPPAPTALALAGPRLAGPELITTARRAVPGAQVTLRSRVLAGLSNAPLPHGGVITFAQGAAAAAGFSLLILVLALVLDARARELTLARLATMGLGPAQALRITAVETLPAILAAALGGTACALALVPLVGPAVDLAAFTGTPVTVPLSADPAAIGAAAGGLLLLAVLALTISSKLARGRGLTQALRVGE